MKLSSLLGFTVAVVGGLGTRGVDLHDCNPTAIDLAMGQGHELNVHGSIHCSPPMVRGDW